MNYEKIARNLARANVYKRMEVRRRAITIRIFLHATSETTAGVIRDRIEEEMCSLLETAEAEVEMELATLSR